MAKLAAGDIENRREHGADQGTQATKTPIGG
jgi:hypothetical protein